MKGVSSRSHCRIFWTPTSELLKQGTVVLVSSKVQSFALPIAASDQLDWHREEGWAKY